MKREYLIRSDLIRIPKSDRSDTFKESVYP